MDRGTIKPVRTALFVAGSEEDELAKSPDYGADLVVIDIEEPRTPYPEHERVRTPCPRVRILVVGADRSGQSALLRSRAGGRLRADVDLTSGRWSSRR
jgi:hypothetical protein